MYYTCIGQELTGARWWKRVCLGEVVAGHGVKHVVYVACVVEVKVQAVVAGVYRPLIGQQECAGWSGCRGHFIKAPVL